MTLILITMYLKQTPKILILENQLIVAADISLQLTKLGYEVIGIHTRSADALLTIAKHRPDIIMMNIENQGTIERLKTAEIIAKTFQIPIIFLSAHTDLQTYKAASKIQPYAFITKPFRTKDLQNSIVITLNRMAAKIKFQKQPLYIIKESTNNEPSGAKT